MQIPRRKSDALRKFDTGPVHLTQAGFDRLKDRLARLKASLPDLIAESARTAAYGDRSENAEYKEAKGLLRKTHRQILSIEDQMKRIEIIPEGPNSSGVVQIGSTVTLEKNGKQHIYQILGSRETNPSHGKISFQSPLGVALMNKAVQDVVIVRTENGEQTYKVIDIR